MECFRFATHTLTVLVAEMLHMYIRSAFTSKLKHWIYFGDYSERKYFVGEMLCINQPLNLPHEPPDILVLEKRKEIRVVGIICSLHFRNASTVPTNMRAFAI